MRYNNIGFPSLGRAACITRPLPRGSRWDVVCSVEQSLASENAPTGERPLCPSCQLSSEHGVPCGNTSGEKWHGGMVCKNLQNGIGHVLPLPPHLKPVFIFVASSG